MFDPGIHQQDLCVPGPSKLNCEHNPIFNSGKNKKKEREKEKKTAQLLQVKTMSNDFAQRYDKIEVESLTEL